MTLWNSRARDRPAYHIRPLLETTACLQDIWDQHLRWLNNVSDRKIKEAAEEEYAVRAYLWRERDDACVDAGRKMLGLLGRELSDGLADVDGNEVLLEREWAGEVKVGRGERSRKRWTIMPPLKR